MNIRPLAILIAAGVTFGASAIAGAGISHALDATEIIKSLAPIEYLPEHGGKPKRAIDLEVQFKVNSADLTANARAQLDALGAALKTRKLITSTFEIAGHTDASGRASHNLTLSQRRAAAVVAYLTKKHGISTKRLKSIGKGETKLKNLVNSRAAENRRVEVTNLTPVKPPKRKQSENINDMLRGR